MSHTQYIIKRNFLCAWLMKIVCIRQNINLNEYETLILFLYMGRSYDEVDSQINFKKTVNDNIYN